MASTAAQNICEKLAEEIINGKLAPGQKIDEQALAARFKVSRTPIREVLRELAARGLIDLRPRRGGMVTEIGADKLSDMLEAMCELEALCAKISAHRMSAMQKKQLEQLHLRTAEPVARGDTRAYLKLNNDFHDLICEGTQNKSLTDMVENFRNRLAPFRSAQGGVKGRLGVSHEEHAQIVAAILAADAEAAYQAMRGHTARLSTRVMDLIKRAHEAKG